MLQIKLLTNHCSNYVSQYYMGAYVLATELPAAFVNANVLFEERAGSTTFKMICKDSRDRFLVTSPKPFHCIDEKGETFLEGINLSNTDVTKTKGRWTTTDTFAITDGDGQVTDTFHFSKYEVRRITNAGDAQEMTMEEYKTEKGLHDFGAHKQIGKLKNYKIIVKADPDSKDQEAREWGQQGGFFIYQLPERAKPENVEDFVGRDEFWRARGKFVVKQVKKDDGAVLYNVVYFVSFVERRKIWWCAKCTQLGMLQSSVKSKYWMEEFNRGKFPDDETVIAELDDHFQHPKKMEWFCQDELTGMRQQFGPAGMCINRLFADMKSRTSGNYKMITREGDGKINGVPEAKVFTWWCCGVPFTYEDVKSGFIAELNPSKQIGVWVDSNVFVCCYPASWVGNFSADSILTMSHNTMKNQNWEIQRKLSLKAASQGGGHAEYFVDVEAPHARGHERWINRLFNDPSDPQYTQRLFGEALLDCA
jgi:hypothetical protein